jgi:hypothetical protein
MNYSQACDILETQKELFTFANIETLPDTAFIRNLLSNNNQYSTEYGIEANSYISAMIKDIAVLQSDWRNTANYGTQKQGFIRLCKALTI